MNYIKINKYSSVPLYVQLRDSIKNAILSGDIKSGDKLPTEAEICERFGLSRTVTRQAICDLVNAGYIVRQKSKGSFVKKSGLNTGFFKEILSFNEETRAAGYIPKTIVLKKEIVEADQRVADRLGIELGEKCIRICRLRFRNDVPVVYVECFMPEKYEMILHKDIENESLYDTLNNELGIRVSHVKRTFEAQIVQADYAHLLEVQKNSAVQFVESEDYDQNSEIVQYSRSYYVGSRNVFEVEINR